MGSAQSTVVERLKALVPRQRWFPNYVEFRAGGVDHAGKGIFTKSVIPKGGIVAQLGGVLVHRDQVNGYLARVGNYGPQVHDDWYISPASLEEVAQTGAINHSCEPNVGMRDALTFVAMRGINPGEELVTDYALTGLMKGFDCCCKTNSCRERVTIDDWKLPMLQEKYGQSFSPHRVRLINPDMRITCAVTLFLDEVGETLSGLKTENSFSRYFFV